MCLKLNYLKYKLPGQSKILQFYKIILAWENKRSACHPFKLKIELLKIV
jgi:hypothetical protein